MYRPAFRAAAFLALSALASLTAPTAHAQSPGSSASAKPPGDLDAFMEKVLARRDVNRATLNQYVLDEVEAFDVLGPGRLPLHRMKREFSGYARDGMPVRSPVRFDGVTVGETARREYERDWISREQARQERRAGKDKEPEHEGTIGADGLQAGGPAAGAEPRFVSEASFMDFKFEPGNYYLAGREKLEGHDVLRIEYYPTHLFNDSDDEKTPREMKKRRDHQGEQDIERKMNKTALVTLWVDPAEHQIVKYTFDNVWLDFLPGAWLVRIDNLRASMTMGQPFAGVWLPRSMNIHAGLMLATGAFEATYDRTFENYRQADVTTTIKVPRLESECQECSGNRLPGSQEAGSPESQSAAAPGESAVPDVREHGPFVEEQQPVETLHEIRVHGNATLSDEEVLKLAGIVVGDPLSSTTE